MDDHDRKQLWKALGVSVLIAIAAIALLAAVGIYVIPRFP